MKHFARLQGQDDQGMIRTNTTVCIGKIAPFINPQLRQRILLSAFPKAMRDPFPLARLSGIVAFANTDSFYTLKDIASKVLPNLCMLTVDPEKDVRDEAFKTIAKYIQKLERVSEKPELALEMEKDVSSCSLDLKNETSWTSWAMTSLSAKMTGYKSKNQQASVALNTQPLGPPPSLTTSTSLPSNKELTPEKTSPKKEDSIKPVKTDNFVPTSVSLKSNETSSGWNIDDDQWKDLDDDEAMEPLEPVPAQAKPNLSTKTTQETKAIAQNSDWSNWTNSFEDNSTTDSQDDFGSFGFSASSSSKTSKVSSSKSLTKPGGESVTKPASSYNWSNSINQEEELFSSLVKDISLNSQKKTASPPSATNTKPAASDWNDEWSEVFDKKSDKKRTDNTSENKSKQSKPLKLGQKKQDPPFF